MMVALFAQQSNIIPFPELPNLQNEWYTSARYIEAARQVMGRIDLDPASCVRANQTVRASHYYTKEQNGLEQPWFGCVWLNPPYGRTKKGTSNIRLFTEKLSNEYTSGNISQAALLTTNRLDAPWNIPLWNHLICFADHGVRFEQLHDTPGRPGRTTSGHIHGTIFVYLGPHEQKFIEVFSQFGTVARRVFVPKQIVRPLSLWEVQ